LSSNDNIAGNYTKKYTSTGRLVPDRFTESLIGLVFASLDEDNTLLVDGFPRMVSQKKMFDDAMQKSQRDFVVFELVISEDEAIKRLASRSICPTCGATYSTLLHGDITHCPLDHTLLQIRDDDRSQDAILERFKLFIKDTKPGLEAYKKE
jgi:adenylate kinase